MIEVRPAGPFDTRQMAELLNEIIAIGGTTALTNPVEAAEIKKWMQADRSAWFVAEDDKGILLGFQWIEDYDTLPDDHGAISTFVRAGQTGLGIGTKLFEEMRTAAQRLGYVAIEAIIRADNEGGLAYYQSRGFENVRMLPSVTLDDGTKVDKIWKRYDLTL
jgi:L-amino acid N-acyltransferase YncA